MFGKTCDNLCFINVTHVILNKPGHMYLHIGCIMYIILIIVKSSYNKPAIDISMYISSLIHYTDYYEIKLIN